MARETGKNGQSRLRDFREGFTAGASQRPDPGDMSFDWKRGWNAGRGAYAEAIRHETRRMDQGRVVCKNCYKPFDPQSSNAVADSGVWYCSTTCALQKDMQTVR